MVFRDYVQFLAHPRIASKAFTLSQKVGLFSFVVVISLFANIFFYSWVLNYLYQLGLVDYAQSDILFNSHSLWDTLLLMPLLTELVYRLHLVPKRRNIMISVTLFILYILPRLFYKIPLLIAHQRWLWAIIICSYVLYLILSSRINGAIARCWNRHFGVVFYGLAILFNLLYFFNYSITLKGWLFIPVMFAPEVIHSLNCGYIRMRLGFIWGVVLRILVLVVFFVSALL
ncbi:hypothetical protein OAT16_03050 [Prolixibacteraceae bacterium]|nr:hypothetical protein [Prolixibacteraceae bacterium]